MSMFDMMNMMGKVKEMQSKMQEAQEKLGEITAEGEAGAGMVKAVVNGKKEVLSIEVEPEIFKPEDAKLTQDLIVAAINNAMRKVEELSKTEMAKVTEGIMPNIPGFDLDSLLKR
jgi:DNA-binding YbaB/EbfC family protein